MSARAMLVVAAVLAAAMAWAWAQESGANRSVASASSKATTARQGQPDKAPAIRAAASKPAPKYDIKLGINASLGGWRCFPDDNPWNQDISKAPLDPNSDKLIASIGKDKPLHPDFGTKGPFGYVVVPGNQPRVKLQIEYPQESDPGPYPIPDDAPIEGGKDAPGDRHVLVLDRDNFVLYELFSSFPLGPLNGWKCSSAAVFDLKSNKLRPAGWTSADAAGLPVFPGLVRGDEAFEQREIRHAVRFTVRKTRRAYVPPATHFASDSNEPALPPMGMRVRLKAGVDISKFPPQTQIVLAGLKKYGMILADNGGDWYISGTVDPRWDDEDLHQLNQIHGSDLEVVRMDGLVTDRR